MIRAVLLFAALAAPAQASTYAFCWRGDEGYRIEGWITVPGGAQGVLTEDDLVGFEIMGWQDDAFLGKWSMRDATEGTSWTLRFDADRLEFPMGGFRENDTYQEWNANGYANDCGNPGFGFNGGNRAQDICVNGIFIDESGIDPDTPLRVQPQLTNPCGPFPMSALPQSHRHG
ncbi:MAG: hypothetical protein AAF919_14955 [Pseudomonadota bacterium]